MLFRSFCTLSIFNVCYLISVYECVVSECVSPSLSSLPGWAEPYGGPQKGESSWGEPAGPPVSVDNGTSAWGKPMDTSSTWEEPGSGSGRDRERDRDRERESSNTWGGSSGPGSHNQHKPGGYSGAHVHIYGWKSLEGGEASYMCSFPLCSDSAVCLCPRRSEAYGALGLVRCGNTGGLGA